MYLVQLLVPLQDNAGEPYAPELLRELAQALTKAFGGVTAYTRSPAKGQWVNQDRVERDDIVAIEVMVEQLDRPWWSSFRKDLEVRLKQRDIVIRAQPMERL